MPTLTPDACELLLHLADDCRAKQKQYFATRKKPALRAALAAEFALDAYLVKCQTPETDEDETALELRFDVEEAPESDPTFPGFEEA